MSLVRLPTEVIREICLVLCYDPTIKNPSRTPGGGRPLNPNENALNNLSRVSRQLHDIATPILYRRCLRDILDTPRFMLLFRTLMQHPELAAHVKEAELDASLNIRESQMPMMNEMIDSLGIDPPDFWDEGGTVPEFLDEDVTEYPDQDPVAHVWGNGQEIVDHERRQRVRRAFVMDLLLSSVKNLQTLSVDAGNDIQYGSLMLPPLDLTALRTLHLFGPRSPHGFRLRTFESLSEQAPNLTKLRVDMCIFTSATLSIRNLTSLTFTSSVIGRFDLRRLIKKCKALQSFTFSLRDAHFILDHLQPRWPLATPGLLVQELSRCKRTLNHLTIWADHKILWNAGVPQDCFITSLAHFSALTTLNLSESCFFRNGVGEDAVCRPAEEFLPKSIQDVTLDNITPASRDIAEQIERQARSLENLRTFQINMCSPGGKRHPRPDT